MTCEHVAERIPGEKPDVHDETGKEFFNSDKLRCSKCHVLWWRLTGEDPKRIQEARVYQKDWYPQEI